MVKVANFVLIPPPPTEQIRPPTSTTENEEVTKLNQQSTQEESVGHKHSIIHPSDERFPESLQPTPIENHGMLLISDENLKTLIEDNIEFKTCVYNCQLHFNKMCTSYCEKEYSVIIQSCTITAKKLLRMKDIISLNNARLWIKYVRQETKKNTSCTLDVQWIGLAFHLTIKCDHHDTHLWSMSSNRTPNGHPRH